MCEYLSTCVLSFHLSYYTINIQTLSSIINHKCLDMTQQNTFLYIHAETHMDEPQKVCYNFALPTDLLCSVRTNLCIANTYYLVKLSVVFQDTCFHPSRWFSKIVVIYHINAFNFVVTLTAKYVSCYYSNNFKGAPPA